MSRLPSCLQGYESVVLFLASLPGTLEQRDGRRETALAVACRRRHSNIEQLLLEAGAKPEHASFGAGPGGSQEGTEGDEEEYCSWSAEERWRYRHGGQGGRAPPGLQRAGRSGSRGGGRGAGRGSSSSVGGRHSSRSMGSGRGWSRGGPDHGSSESDSAGGELKCPW